MKLTEVERKIAGIVASIEDGAWNRALGVRLDTLEQEQTVLKAEIAAAADVAPSVVRLHPRAADLYRDKVVSLEASLSQPEIRQEAADALRSLIDRVTLTPDATASDSLRVELVGALGMILSAVSSEHGNARSLRPGVFACRYERQSSVVAGTGFEPVTFRL